MIIAVSGLVVDAENNKGSAGAGKSTVCDRLVDKHKFVSISFADPMKRFVMDIFDWDPKMLWGSTELKSKPDRRYWTGRTRGPDSLRGAEQFIAEEDGRVLATITASLEGRAPTEAELLASIQLQVEEQGKEYLTPRLALQLLGSEWGRKCYPSVWAAYAMRIAQRLQSGGYYYDAPSGLRPWAVLEGSDMAKPKTNVCFPDMRFRNEMETIKAMGGKVIRVVRNTEKLFIDNAHVSENDLNEVPDSEFDYVIHGLPKDVPDLQLKTDKMIEVLR